MRPAVVYGLLHAGLAIARSLGREGIPVEGIALQRYEFGLRSRYLRERTLRGGRRRRARGAPPRGRRRRKPVLFPERDENVEIVLRRWDEVRELADVPLPDDPEAARRLRRKDLLPQVAAEAGVPSPRTVRAESPEPIREAGLRAAAPAQAARGPGVRPRVRREGVRRRDLDEAVAAWKRAKERGFDTIVQELIPDSHEHVFSLFTYIGRDGRAARERRRPQGPAGPAALRHERGLRLGPRRRGARAGPAAPARRRLPRPRARRARPRPARRAS